MGLLDGIKRYGEPGLGLLTGAVAEPVAGWAGLLTGNAKNVEAVRNMMTYRMRSAAGQAGQNALANAMLGVTNLPPVRATLDGFNALADGAGAYHPLLGAAVKTAPAALMSFAGPGSSVTRKAFANVAADTGRAMAPKVGQMAENYMRRTGGLLDMDVYHGSPHKFDKFDSSKIGTGEGAQAYGHGLYVAESPDVAKSYQTANSFRAFDIGEEAQKRGIPLNAGGRGEFSRQAATSYSPEDAAKYLQYANSASRDIPRDQLAKMIADYRDASKGAFYKADLPDEHIAKMLDYDNPVPDAVRKPLSKAALDKFGNGLTDTSGEKLYNEVIFGFKQLGHPNPTQAATDWLTQQGIPGMRYLDGGSRGTGAGSSNFVVFPGNEGMLTILERNGMPVK